MHTGPKNLITDVAGLKVGNATDKTRKTGTTVLLGEEPFVASYTIMGGAPGTRDTDMLEPDKSCSGVDALVLSGGSAYGLDAATGVMDVLRDQGRGAKFAGIQLPLAPCAIVFDLANGGAKDWDRNPYADLGRQAVLNATETFELGTAGAGTGATTACLKGGLGSASQVLENGITVGALVAVNPIGCVTTPGERHFWAAPFEVNGEFGGLGPDMATGIGIDAMRSKPGRAMSRTNTTIAIVATDAVLTKAQAKRVSTAAHDGIGRAVVPAHMPADGDLVFSAATGGSGIEADDLLLMQICHAAAICLARAIARGVYLATDDTNDKLPTWQKANT